MMTLSQLNTVSTPRLTAPKRAAGEPQAEAAPGDQVSLSNAPQKRSWLGGKLAKTAMVLGLSACALGVFTAPAQAQSFWPQPQTERSQVGITMDSHGRVGVYVGSETYNRNTGVYERGGISVGPNGVGIDYGVQVMPRPQFPCQPPQTMPWNGQCPPPRTMPWYGHQNQHRHQHPQHRQHQQQQVIINGPVIINQGW